MPERTEPSQTILVINSGSSSLKAALFAGGEGAGNGVTDERLLLAANATGIGQTEGKLSIKDGDGKPLAPSDGEDKHDYRSQAEALAAIAGRLAEHAGDAPVAVGHRIVHGGMHLTAHQQITPAVLEQLEQAVHFAPLHIPGSLELIRKAEELYPGVPQFACFDTAFHQTLPERAWRLPIPEEWTEKGVRRYGFHGLSYESIVAQLRGEGPVPERLIVAHLGSGSSLAAIERGRSVDTSMGLTPTGGVPMATRTGDLDPGVLIFLMRAGGLTLDETEALVNHDSGLRALSGGISDMQKLEAAAGAPGGHQAGLAFEIFATAVAKTIASYIVSLEGLDLLVFTGGIGEHSASFRAAVCERLRALGVMIDGPANRSHAGLIGLISGAASRVPIRILPAQEDLQIARHVRSLLASRSGWPQKG
jgi:acetate kinase